MITTIISMTRKHQNQMTEEAKASWVDVSRRVVSFDIRAKMFLLINRQLMADPPARYGYKDTMKEPHVFEQQLVQKLKDFIKHEHFIHEAENIPKPDLLGEGSTSSALIQSASFDNKRANIPLALLPGAEEQMRFIDKAMDQGVFYLLGEVEVVAKKDSSLVKKIVINYAYTFLRKNFRHGEEMLAIPQKRLLKVGMTCEV